jgi:hypothetical protein
MGRSPELAAVAADEGNDLVDDIPVVLLMPGIALFG